jgi:hypothetical protein
METEDTGQPEVSQRKSRNVYLGEGCSKFSGIDTTETQNKSVVFWTIPCAFVP